MGEETKIAWADSTFSPWVGCTKVSAGCQFCYASDYDRRVGGVPKHQRPDPSKPLLRWGKGAPRTRTSVANWKKPLAWNAKAKAAGTRPRVFCSSLADVFDDEVPLKWLADLATLIDQTPLLDWLLLTKRPENYGRWAMLNDATKPPVWPRNVWLGVTVENQEQANRRIPLLLAQHAAVRFLSMEPLLEHVDLESWLDEDHNGFAPGLHQVIIGGESGPKARPFDLGWARSLVAQCRDAGVAAFVKQMGDAPVEHLSTAVYGGGFHLPVRKAHHGADPAEWPEDLRVQEFPVRR